jgi:CHAT domain-containing protein/Flp pilus assembly protein TadD
MQKNLMQRIEFSRIGFLLLILLLEVSEPVKSQLWKQYADSAEVLYTQQDFKKSYQIYSQARIALPHDSLGTSTYGQISYRLGILLFKLSKMKDAEQFFLESLSIREKINGTNSLEYANSCNAMGAFYFESSEFQKAEDAYSKALRIYESLSGKKSRQYYVVCYNLAQLYTSSSQYALADSLFDISKTVCSTLKGKSSEEYALICLSMADLSIRLANFSKAESLTMEARAIFAKINGRINSNYGTSCAKLAGILYKIGNLRDAVPLYIEALSIQEKTNGKLSDAYAHDEENLGDLYIDLGQYEKAETLLTESISIAGQVYNRTGVNYAYFTADLAALYAYEGEFQKAEPLYREAYNIIKMTAGPNHPQYAALCNNMAQMYIAMGEYEKAEKLIIEAISVQEKSIGKNHPEYAVSCTNLGNLYTKLGHLEKAEPWLVEAQNVYQQTYDKNHPAYGSSCINIANLYTKLGRFKESESLLKEAIQIYASAYGSGHPEYALCCMNLGNLYEKMGRYEEARKLYNEARQIERNSLGRFQTGYSTACDYLFNLDWKQKMSREAYHYMLESVNVKKTILYKFFRFTNEKEKAIFLNNVIGSGDGYYSFFWQATNHKQAGPIYDLSLFNRELILSSNRSLKRFCYSSNNETLQRKYRNWIDLKNQLAYWYSKPIADRKSVIGSLEKQSGEDEKEIMRLLPDFKREINQKNNSWRKIQQQLGWDEAALEFIRFRYQCNDRATDSVIYIALLTRKNLPEPKLIFLFEEKQLSKLFAKKGTKNDNDYINQMYGRGIREKRNYPDGLALYKLIWKPIEKSISGIQKIYFAPCGLLYKISFAALALNNNMLLSDRYRLVQLNTTASIARDGSREKKIDNLTLFGAIDYDADSLTLKTSTAKFKIAKDDSRGLEKIFSDRESWNYLDGTKTEVNGIKKIADSKNISSQLLTGSEATEESFKALEGLRSPDAIHIATHGFFYSKATTSDSLSHVSPPDIAANSTFRFADDPLLRSAILFAGANHTWHGQTFSGLEDGILTAYEVSNMYLPNTELVVMSACETGLGEVQGTEGVYGLQRAFKSAGVTYLLMSLWKVPDRETSEFMITFYEALFGDRKIEDAFEQAQKFMKKKYSNQPYKWAAWILVK